jgi:hypothetical protein
VSFAFTVADFPMVAIVALPLAFVSTLANLKIICFSKSRKPKIHLSIFVVPKLINYVLIVFIFFVGGDVIHHVLQHGILHGIQLSI